MFNVMIGCFRLVYLLVGIVFLVSLPFAAMVADKPNVSSMEILFAFTLFAGASFTGFWLFYMLRKNRRKSHV